MKISLFILGTNPDIQSLLDWMNFIDTQPAWAVALVKVVLFVLSVISNFIAGGIRRALLLSTDPITCALMWASVMSVVLFYDDETPNLVFFDAAGHSGITVECERECACIFQQHGNIVMSGKMGGGW